MSQTIDTPSYTIELSDGSIRPMTVKELAIRLEQLMSADKGIAEMPVGLSVDSEGNGVYVPRVFVPKEAGGDNPMDKVVGVIAEEDRAYYGVPECVLIVDWYRAPLCEVPLFSNCGPMVSTPFKGGLKCLMWRRSTA